MRFLFTSLIILFYCSFIVFTWFVIHMEIVCNKKFRFDLMLILIKNHHRVLEWLASFIFFLAITVERKSDVYANVCAHHVHNPMLKIAINRKTKLRRWNDLKWKKKLVYHGMFRSFFQILSFLCSFLIFIVRTQFYFFSYNACHGLRDKNIIV